MAKRTFGDLLAVGNRVVAVPDSMRRTNSAGTGREITNARAKFGSLVVLAACRTSRGRISSEGAMSLARSFLVNGSTTVIGSLWNVNDEASDELFAAFYRHLAKSRSAADALRLAQLEISAIHPEPRYWAGFQTYGGT